MSSEPDQYPIENRIVPLVYALYTLRLLTPCWSCEGHLDPESNIWKKPKVWFNSTSAFYPKLISQVIGGLQGQHKISQSWCVKILPFSQSMFTTTYSIEPDSDDASLAELHTDISVLGKLLRYEMMTLASSYVKRAG
jgi:hypothetical protein